MLGNWNVIAKETANNNIPGQKAVSSSLPNMRAELSSEQMLSSSVPGQDATAAQRIRHVTRIVHRNRGGSKKMNLATALLSHSKLAAIVSGGTKEKGSKVASPPVKRNSYALQKFKAKARKIIEVERQKKEEDAKLDQHPRLDYLNAQAYEYLRKCEYTKQLILKIQDKIKRSKKAVTVLWKLRREYQHKKDHERRWTPRDVEHREFDMVTAKQELSINKKQEIIDHNKVDEARKVNLTKSRARDQIQTYIDTLVAAQERHVRKVHEMEALTDMMEMEHQADVRADRQLVLHWEMEYNSLRRECEQLERKSLDQRMKETKHLNSPASGGVQISSTKVGMNNLLSHMTGASRKGKINIVAEMRLKSKNSKLNWQTAKQKIFINLRATTLKDAEDGMLRLRAETGLHDVETLVLWYEENETKHYDLFKELDANERRLEDVRKSVKKLRKDLSVFSGHGNTVNHVKNEIAKRAQDRIVAFNRATEACKANFDHSQRLILRTCQPVEKIFERLGEKETETNSHLTAKGVSQLSIMQFLGIIDQRVTEMLQFNEMVVDGPWGSSNRSRGPSRKENRATSPMRSPEAVALELMRTVQPPTVNEVASAAAFQADAEGDVIEDSFSSVILTRDQLKLKSVDFYAARESLKSQRLARASNQKEQVERMTRSGTDNSTVNPGVAMRRLRKGMISS